MIYVCIYPQTRFLLEETLPDDETEFVRACDIKHLVTYLRDQRMGMVQTEEQYLFCYAATIDYVRPAALHLYLHVLRCIGRKGLGVDDEVAA